MADQPFHGRDVVVTGGTGALGIAVVGALLEAGATCHVPYVVAAEATRFPHRDHPRVTLIADFDLADEASVAAAARDLKKRLGGDLTDFLLQPMVPGGAQPPACRSLMHWWRACRVSRSCLFWTIASMCSIPLRNSARSLFRRPTISGF